GYAHPKIVEAVCSQVTKFGHLSNNYITDIQIQFAELLLKYSGMSKVFLSNSGTEANEAALKIIRKKFGPGKKIFSLTKGFHGRTFGSLSLTDREKYRKDFEPLMPNVGRINFNDVNDLKAKINEDTAAIFIEFIQGEGGVNIVSNEFISVLKDLKNKYSFAVVADEIQSGIGRTGEPFAYDHFSFKPDLVTSAKAIGGGLPLGAALSSPELDGIFETGKHGTTFGGNPVSCAAGIVVLKEVFENGLMEHVKESGDYFIDQLNELKGLFPDDIKYVRGKGFMIGVELFYEGNNIVEQMRERKVLTNCTSGNVLRILPPLIAGKDEIDFFLYNLHEILKNKH
ncbi:MAG: aminotransferase class III-fold pyridoxal phosphate-dependent enzyme, partial [Ignavibacteriaceae bacterium]